MSVVESGEANVSNCVFMNNTARFNGGGIFVNGKSRVRLNASNLISNEAGEKGGGIGMLEDSSLISHSTAFLRNKADWGAGLYILSNDEAPIVAQLANNTLVSNSAEKCGGNNVFLFDKFSLICSQVEFISFE